MEQETLREELTEIIGSFSTSTAVELVIQLFERHLNQPKQK